MPEQVQLLNETTISTPLPNGDVHQLVEITYQAIGLAPRRVYIAKDQDTLEERRRVIKEDLERARHLRPTLFESA